MIKKIYLSASVLLGVSLTSAAQPGSMKNIGQAADWTQTIAGASMTHSKSEHTPSFSIPTPYGASLPVSIQVKNIENGTVMIAGDDQNGNFSLSTDVSGKVNGFYHSITERKAYRYTTDKAGNVFATEVPIESMICMDFARVPEVPSDEAEASKRPARTTAIPKYSSKPDSKYVIYIDLDGESSNSKWGNINAQPLQAWTDAEVLEIWQVPAQDYLPWDVNVTTDRSVYDATPLSRKMMCIVTSTLTAANNQSIGGIAHIGSFGSTSLDPCWVFNKGVKVTGETVSHEVGHTVGLNHDGKGSAVYYQGHNSWAPIMGAVYSTSTIKIDNPNALGHWSMGEYTGATNGEDDLYIIGSQNGFDWRTDEHGNKANSTATALAIELDGTVTSAKNKGIINDMDDLDVFKFTIGAGDIDLLVAPYYNTTDLNRYPNLNVKLRLLNSSGTAIATVDSLPPTDFNTWAAMSANLKINGIAAGTYYLEVDGTKQGATPSVGYSDYCSIGGFNISGMVPKPVGILQEEKISQFNVYPNPSSGAFSLSFNTIAKSNYKLSVLNTLGQIVYEEELIGFNGAYAQQLNLASYGKGVFLINIADEESSFTKRVVIY